MLLLIATIVSSALAILGLVALVVAWWLPTPSLVKCLRETYAKCIIEILRWFSACVVLYLKVIENASSDWNYVVGTCISAWLFWALTQILIEHRTKAALVDIAAKDREIKVLERQIDIRTSIIAQVHGVVSDKHSRLNRVKLNQNRNRRHKDLLGRLSPLEQMHLIVARLGIALLNFHDAPNSAAAQVLKFRIGLYVENRGFLEPLVGIDISNRGYDPFSSFKQHRERFRLDNTLNPSKAVQCVVEHLPIIVPDTLADPDFEFFEGSQSNYLRSMIAYPIEGIKGLNGKTCKAAIVVDVPCSGFFKVEDAELLGLVIDEFGIRLALESHLLYVVDSVEETSNDCKKNS